MNIAKFLTIFSGLSGIGAAGTIGTHKITSQTIEAEAKICLPAEINDSEIWEKVFEKKWKKSSSKSDKKFFNSLEKEDWESLKRKCEKSYKETYSSAITSKKDILLEETKEFCSINIQDLLDKPIDINNSEASSQNETLFKKIITENSSKVEEITSSDLKKIIESGEIKWENLKKWCNDSYKLNYLGEKDKLNETKEYCSNK